MTEPIEASRATRPVQAEAEAAGARDDATIFSFRRNVVVAASAGTGKTHRLTALYILLTLGLTSMGQPDDRTPAPPVLPDRILATTFSRAAALEIARRIERSLRALAAWDGMTDVDYAFTREIRARAALVGMLVDAPDHRADASPVASASFAAEIRKRASEAIARWPAARIDTLHGAARQIVQRHALDLGVPPGAEVLDEDETQALSVLAIDETLTEALSAGGERAQAARMLIVSCGGIAMARREVTRLFDRLDEDGITARELARADHTGQAAAVARELGRIAKQSAAEGSRAFREPAEALARALAAAPEGELFPDKAFGPAVDLLTQTMPRKGKTSADEELDAFRKKLSGSTHAERASRLVSYLREAPKLAAREEHLIDLLDDARTRLEAARRRAGGLSFGDLLRIARDGMRDRPDVARAARASVNVLMVDEFQDTSRVQRDLVYLFRERDGAAGMRAPGASPRAEGLLKHGLFLVGDRKQSIYGFRGADVAVFARVCAELAGSAAGEALSLPPSLWAPDPIADFVALRESRRSGERVLAFVNAFAARDFAEGRAPEETPRDFEIAYGRAEHLVPAPQPSQSSGGDGGEVILVSDDGGTPDDADPLVREATGPMREALVAAAYVACRVRRSGDQELLAGRAVSYRDVAILARRRSSIPLIELALARLEVPYVVAGRALYDAPEVRDIAALLRLLLDPRDRLALATVLRGPMVALSDTGLALLSPPGRGLVVTTGGRSPLVLGAESASAETSAAIAQLDAGDRSRLENFRARFADLRRAALLLPPGEAIRAAVAALDLDRVLAALPRAEAKIGNIDRLVAIARQRGGSLSSFVRWLDRRMRDEADEAEAAVFSPEDDAVRLTTIHASKGLDFPVVVLVDLNAQPRATSAGIGFVPSSVDKPASLVVRHFARRASRPQAPDTSAADSAARELAPWIPVGTPAQRDAQTDAQAREQAERRRLTYVAVTRARRSLVLIGSAAPARPGSAWRTLSTGLDDPGFAATLTHREDAKAWLHEASLPAAPSAAGPAPEVAELIEVPSGPPFLVPPRSPSREIALALAPLSVFHGCARRFRFRHLLGLEEPVSTGQLDLFGDEMAPDLQDDDVDESDPDAPISAAHRVLERWPRARWGAPTNPAEIAARLAAHGLAADHGEALRLAPAIASFLSGPYARVIRDEDCAIRREEPFVLTTVAPTAGRTGARALTVRGAIDLVVERRSGAIDALDYKLSRPRADLALHELRLRAYALALHKRHPDRPIRAGVIYLGASVEPTILRGDGPGGAITDADHERFEDDLASLAHRFAEARHQDRFDGVPVDVCRRLQCGFVGACHGDKRAARSP